MIINSIVPQTQNRAQTIREIPERAAIEGANVLRVDVRRALEVVRNGHSRVALFESSVARIHLGATKQG